MVQLLIAFRLSQPLMFPPDFDNTHYIGAELDRRALTFEQAEGLAPLPSQLKRDELSKELRAKLWAYLCARIYPHYHDILNHIGTWFEACLCTKEKTIIAAPFPSLHVGGDEVAAKRAADRGFLYCPWTCRHAEK